MDRQWDPDAERAFWRRTGLPEPDRGVTFDWERWRRASVPRMRRRVGSARFMAGAAAIMLAFIVSGAYLFTRTGGSRPHAMTGGPRVGLLDLAALAASGQTLYIASPDSNQVDQLTKHGQVRRIAGTGQRGDAGNGGPAADATLNDPLAVAMAPNGTLYIADTGNNQVRAILPNGTLTTVAGTGRARGASQGSARAVSIAKPVAVAPGPNASLYIVDNTGVQVLALGRIRTFLRAGAGVTIGGVRVSLRPDAVAVNGAGDVLVADASPKLLIEFSPAGRVITSWSVNVSEAGLSESPDGSVLVADQGTFSIDRVSHGRLSTVAQFQRNGIVGLPGMVRPAAVVEEPGGALVVDTAGGSGTTQGAVVKWVHGKWLLVLKDAAR